MSSTSTSVIATSTEGYDPTLFAPLAAIEDRHFWFRVRSQVLGGLAQQIMASREQPYRILELGCGTGRVLRTLEQACQGATLMGMDLFGDGLAVARQRTSCGLVQGDMRNPPFRAQFDLIGLFDVLEHLADDIQALRDIYAMLAPGGALLLTVPAHQELWSYFDEQHHYRRYALAELRGKLTKAGYEVEYITQYMAALYPLVWAGRRLASQIDRRPDKDPAKTHDLTVQEMRVIPIVNELMLSLLGLEQRLLLRRVSLPIGTSLLTIARKPNG